MWGLSSKHGKGSSTFCGVLHLSFLKKKKNCGFHKEITCKVGNFATDNGIFFTSNKCWNLYN